MTALIKRLFLPIEIKVREFHSKLLFALFASERGFETVLGGQIELIEHMPRLSKGLYLDKSTSILKAEWFRQCQGLGNRVAAWDEEGLLYLSDEVYHVTRMQRESFELIDLFFTWGAFHTRTVLDRYPEASDRVVPTGNPRMDLLRPEFRKFNDEAVSTLRRKHGRILLINTNFPLGNYIRGPETVSRAFSSYPLKNKGELLEGWYTFQKQGLEHFMKAADAMREHFSDHTIVIRPAPAEDRTTWERRFANESRVVVSNEGNVVEWIRAADAVVQFNCTTGIEAFLLDIPTIAYRCVKSEIYETHLSISCSREAATLDELIVQLNRAIADRATGVMSTEGCPRGAMAIKDYLASYDGPTACERILDEIERRQFTERPYTLPPVPLIKRVWRKWLKVVRRPDPMDIRVYKQKFPGLTAEEGRKVASAFSHVTGRFKEVNITRVAPGIISVAPSKVGL